jgi:hypothetical protein
VLLWQRAYGGGKEAALVLVGTFVGWFYLRFYRFDEDTQQVGDMSDAMEFASLFPNVLNVQAYIRFVSTLLFSAVTRLGCLTRAVQSQQEQQKQQHQRGGSGGTSSSLLRHDGDQSDGGSNVANDEWLQSSFTSMDPMAQRRLLLARQAISDKVAELENEQNAMQADGGPLSPSAFDNVFDNDDDDAGSDDVKSAATATSSATSATAAAPSSSGVLDLEVGGSSAATAAATDAEIDEEVRKAREVVGGL